MARKLLLNIVWFRRKPFARVFTSEYNEAMFGPNVTEHVLQTDIDGAHGSMRTSSLGAAPDELVAKLHESAARCLYMWCRMSGLWGSMNLSVYMASCGYGCEYSRVNEASDDSGATRVIAMVRMDDIANIVYDQL